MEELTSVYFQMNTLGWDANTWLFIEGSHPTFNYCEHISVTVPGKDATCTETGLTEGKVCSICGGTTVAQEVIPTKLHTLEKVDDKYVCTFCGETFIEEEITVYAGEVKQFAINTADYSNIITVSFKFAQNGTAPGGAGIDAALLAIDKKCALRVTGGGATHIMNADGIAHSNNWWGYRGDDYPNTMVDCEFIIDVSSGIITYKIGYDLSSPNVEGTLTSSYPFNSEIVFSFGGTSGKDVTIKDFTII